MVAPTAGLLKRPSRRGFMSPLAILQFVRMIELLIGADAKEEALREAEIFRLPEDDEPVREQKVARLHAAVRRLWPEDAEVIGRHAGEAAGQYIVEHRLPGRSQQLLARMPRSAAAWLLSRRTQQQDWTFAGSGRFTLETSARFRIDDNPMTRGERTNHPICHYHVGLFERQFRMLVHPDMRCSEIACSARGDESCRFHLEIPGAHLELAG